jgi:hypothetical protein
MKNLCGEKRYTSINKMMEEYPEAMDYRQR